MLDCLQARAGILGFLFYRRLPAWQGSMNYTYFAAAAPANYRVYIEPQLWSYSAESYSAGLIRHLIVYSLPSSDTYMAGWRGNSPEYMLLPGTFHAHAHAHAALFLAINDSHSTQDACCLLVPLLRQM